jgi:hypothetical protein
VLKGVQPLTKMGKKMNISNAEAKLELALIDSKANELDRIDFFLGSRMRICHKKLYSA